MSYSAPQFLDTAFVQPGTPTFADLIQKLAEDCDQKPGRRRDMLSGLRVVAKAIGREVEQIPADAHWLQPRLAKITPVAINMTAKTWSNAQSNMRAALVLFGQVERRISRKSDLVPEWRRLWGLVLASGDQTLNKSMSRLVYFLSHIGVAPEAVAEHHLLAFLQAITVNEVRRSPDSGYRRAVNGWNLAVQRIPQWPQQSFTLPSRAKRTKLDLATFPPAFAEDIARYARSLAEPDLFDSDSLADPLRPASIEQYCAMLQRFASVLVSAGVPVAEIDGLAALVRIENAERGLRVMHDLAGKQNTPSLSDMASLLKNMAKRYVGVDEISQNRLDYLTKRLAPKFQPGMTSKNRDRLRPLQDARTLQKLLLLPEQLFDRAKRDKDPYRAAMARENAIAIAILLYCPIRRKNLSEIHLEQNLQRPGDGRVFMDFEPDDVKNHHRIEFELQPSVADMIDLHLKTRSPELCPLGTQWLFPRRDGSGSTSMTYFASRIKVLIKRETGLTVNMHLFRHIAAMIWLNAQPGQYEVAKRLLSHSTLSNTINAYAGFEAGTSTRLFAAVVDAAKRA